MKLDGRWLTVLPDWLRAGRADYEAAQQKRLSPRYLAKKRKVKTLWLVAGVLIIINPQLGFAIIVLLFTIFLSFAILDN